MKHLSKEEFKPLFEEASADCARLYKQFMAKHDDPATIAMAMIRVAIVSLVAAVGQEQAANSASNLVNTALREGAHLVKLVEEEDENNFPSV